MSKSFDKEKLTAVLVTDCGSTTTKALLFERNEQGQWRQTYRGEAPTTVEAPVADVTVGALNAFAELEEISGRKILKTSAERQSYLPPFNFKTNDPRHGIDLYLSTSSAGGGLQMMVAGVVKDITTQSAQRAALGAGAIVLEAISADDGREEYRRIEEIRKLRPDIILLTGGVDGGTKSQVLEVAEILLSAAPRPRFGHTLKVPVIYAGNSEARQEISSLLGEVFQLQIVDNVRPNVERENLSPAREAIHELFLSHVMSHSPGYDKLMSWSPFPIMPTPAAVGDMIKEYAENSNQQVLAVDIGGATTDIFSVLRDEEQKLSIFNRTVSANLGMSYSVANVLVESGVENIARWLPYQISEEELKDNLRNKMIRPTSIPQTVEDLWLEQAVAREALRYSLRHHKMLAVGLSGVKRRRGIADIFKQRAANQQILDISQIDLVIGSGGVLSHAPNRLEALLIMLDAFELQGITQVALDSIFMLPHLGALNTVHPEAACEIFLKDCLINVGSVIAPVYSGYLESGINLAKIYFNGEFIDFVRAGEIDLYQLEIGMRGELKVLPLSNYVDVGAGFGKELKREIEVGLVGLLSDGRNRPLSRFAITPEYQKRLLGKLELTQE
ncbi:MAG TPA: glutamate mutase L [Oligoflexia bacterium]|nr:glutamate mutase L [Oligoflexia bacterium]HMP27234.1 glutamate mutase L [Oligoflexia bacterium]